MAVVLVPLLLMAERGVHSQAAQRQRHRQGLLFQVIPGFRATVREYFRQADVLCRRLLRPLALALGQGVPQRNYYGGTSCPRAAGGSLRVCWARPLLRLQGLPGLSSQSPLLLIPSSPPCALAKLCTGLFDRPATLLNCNRYLPQASSQAVPMQ